MIESVATGVVAASSILLLALRFRFTQSYTSLHRKFCLANEQTLGGTVSWLSDSIRTPGKRT
jgi:hypothetical protein